MTTAWQPGQLLFVGWSTPQPSDELLKWIAAGRVGGVVLFRRNIGEPSAVQALIAQLRQAAPADAPLIVAIDQEGGRVQRLREPWTVWPPARTFGDRQDPLLIQGFARALAQELLDLGITLNFAPVVDIATRPDNPAIGDRSFAATPEAVAQWTALFIAAAQGAGLACCAKHFPGHGDTAQDSHHVLPTLSAAHDKARLEAVELVPFRRAVAAKVASIMTAHVIFPAIDAKRPATLSPALFELLRNELNYDGLAITDDLEMKAVADHYTARERVLGPLEAGADVIMICSQADLQSEALSYLERAPDRLVEASLRRMVAFKRDWGRAGLPNHAERDDREPLPTSLPPYPHHQALANAVREGRPWHVG